MMAQVCGSLHAKLELWVPCLGLASPSLACVGNWGKKKTEMEDFSVLLFSSLGVSQHIKQNTVKRLASYCHHCKESYGTLGS